MLDHMDSPDDLPVGPDPTFIAAFNGMAQRVHQTSRDKGWYDEPNAMSAFHAVQRFLVFMDRKEFEGDAMRGLYEELLPFTQRTDGDFIALMHSELSEAIEGVRRPGPDRHCPEYTQVEVELADTIIRIMDYGRARGLNIAEALVAKAKVNQGRDHRHGGATI